MRQVPSYLLIGNGRLATHLKRYYALMQQPLEQWHRALSRAALAEKVSRATHILLAVSDHAILEVINALPKTTAFLIHFSGALATQRAIGAHPLMTFHAGEYTLPTYQSIPFILDDTAPDFRTLFPGFSNPHARLPLHLKAKYHAYCVMAANFSCLLWQAAFKAFQTEFSLKTALLYPLMQQQMANLMQDPHRALTGPLVRKDYKTIEQHLTALQEDPHRAIYQAFLSLEGLNEYSGF